MYCSKENLFELLENNQIDRIKEHLLNSSEIDSNTIMSLFYIAIMDFKENLAKFLFANYKNCIKQYIIDDLFRKSSSASKELLVELTTPPLVKQSPNFSESDLAFLKKIKEVRNRIRNLIEPFIGMYPKSLNIQQKNIICDALTYLTFKQSKNSIDFCIDTNPLIQQISSFNSFLVFLKELDTYKYITLQNVIYSAVGSFNLDTTDTCLKNIIENSDIVNFPDANLAINIYILKGKFNWTNFSSSDFYYYLNSDLLDNMPDGTNINCWEAVLSAMCNAGLVNTDYVKKCYASPEPLSSLREWFDFSLGNQISKNNWIENLSGKSQFIMSSTESYPDGLHHDMLSVPFSQKQLLKMLITKKFDTKPTTIKLFSHWTSWTNGTLGTLNKTLFTSCLNDSFEFRVRPALDLKQKSNFSYDK